MLTVARIISIAAVAIAALRIAWIGDDALITLRTALNLANGWGPGFNVTESVQAYTHPLWFLLWVAIGSLTDQWVLGILGASVALTGLAVGLLVWRAESVARIILATGLLVLSNAFIEYATSGLENPLAYALVGLLMVLTLGPGPGAGRSGLAWATALGLASGALVLTRYDLALLIAPVVTLTVIRHRRQPGLVGIGAVAALAPLAIWFAWSWVTYSAIVPNTFEAKRNIDIPQFELIVQGFRYLWVTFEHDPVSLVALPLGLGMAFAVGRGMERAWATGVLLYLAYVVWVGGDFMAGRFLAVPVYVAVFLLVVSKGLRPDNDSRPVHASSIGAAAGIVAVLLIVSSSAGSTPVALANTQTQRWAVDTNLNAGVGDERGVYAEQGHTLKAMLDTLALAYVKPNIVPIGDGTGLSRTLREIDKSAREWPPRPVDFTNPSEVGVFCGMLGTVGIATGPITHLVDSCALTDRFLAGAPATARDYNWKPGHFHREIPEGYLEAVATRDPTRVVDPAERFRLTELWSRIRPEIASAPATG